MANSHPTHSCWYNEKYGYFECRSWACAFIGDLKAAIEHIVKNQYTVKEDTQWIPTKT